MKFRRGWVHEGKWVEPTKAFWDAAGTREDRREAYRDALYAMYHGEGRKVSATKYGVSYRLLGPVGAEYLQWRRWSVRPPREPQGLLAVYVPIKVLKRARAISNQNGMSWVEAMTAAVNAWAVNPTQPAI